MTIEKVACPTCFVSSNVELVELDAVCGSFVYIYKCSHCGGRWVVFEQLKENEDMNREEKKINWDKPLRTVKGKLPIRLLCTDLKTVEGDSLNYAIAVTTEVGSEFLTYCEDDGTTLSGLEIENVPEKRTIWINIHETVPGRITASTHQTGYIADAQAGLSRIARIRTEWEEGQFDE